MQRLEYRSKQRLENLRELGQVVKYLAHRALGLWRPLLPLLISALLLTLAFAPVSQFYLAWVGLAPWLVFVHWQTSQRRAFFWSWIGGTIFFTANMWWMGFISVPGMVALMIYCGIYWGFAALVIRGAGLLSRGVAGVFGIAAVWVAFEWLRGNLLTGLPWLFLGHTQTSILPMCQIADITGGYGVSFWVAAVNALVALAWIHRDKLKLMWPGGAAVAALLIMVLIYGIARIAQTAAHLQAGPVVCVIQPNDPQSNDGSKGAKPSERLKFHLGETTRAIASSAGMIDMAVWSETMLPPINQESRRLDSDWQEDFAAVSQLTASRHIALLSGGEYVPQWVLERRGDDTYPVPRERRNTAYFFDDQGVMSDLPGKRYDKIHLVPWGEFVPFKHSIPFLYNIFIYLGPQYYADYELAPGGPEALTVFELHRDNHVWRFVTPICFEDIDPRICADMFRPDAFGPIAGAKRADFLVNITNDGWFRANENAQHFQAAVFRAIENRVPAARSVNTGISGFIDSTGKAHHLLPVRTAGSSAAQLWIDDRLTIYTLYGDVFAGICIGATALIALAGWIRRRAMRKAVAPQA